jgi:hypothetical protein
MKLTHIVFLILVIAAVHTHGGDMKGPRGDGPKRDGPSKKGPRGDGPKRDGPSKKGPKGDGPKGDGPSKSGALPLIQITQLVSEAPQVDSLPTTPQMKCIMAINLDPTQSTRNGRLLKGQSTHSAPTSSAAPKAQSNHANSGAAPKEKSNHANTPATPKEKSNHSNGPAAPKEKSNHGKGPDAHKEKSNHGKGPDAHKEKSNHGKGPDAHKEKSNHGKGPDAHKEKSTHGRGPAAPKAESNNAVDAPAEAGSASAPGQLKKQRKEKPIEITHAPEVDYTKVVSSLLSYFPFLDTPTRAKLQSCNLDLSKALQRCEGVYGTGNCEQTEIGAQKKCPAGTLKFGCCLCAVACPNPNPNVQYYEENNYYCTKKTFPKSAMYKTESECIAAGNTVCESWVGALWVPKCKQGFRRVGADQCVLLCPEGWTDSGRICFKPNTTPIGAPFNWNVADN